MREIRQISGAEEFQTVMWILCPQKRSLTPHSSRVGCGQQLPSQVCMWKRNKGVTSQWRHLTNTTSARGSGSTTMVISHVDSIYPSCDDNGNLPLWSSSKNIRIPSTTMRKIADNYLNWGTFYKIPDQCSSALSRSCKTRKVWETIADKGSLMSYDD